VRLIALELFQVIAGLLAAYGALGGLRIENLVLATGVLAVVIGMLAAWSVERNVRAWWGTVLGFSALIAIAGLDRLGRPECAPTGRTLGCVPPGWHVAAVIALVCVVGSLLAGMYDVLQSRRRTPSAEL